MTIGIRIRNARKSAGLTQVELAKKVNLSRSYIGDIEKDRYNASVHTLKAIATALEIDIATLVSTDTPAPPPTSNALDLLDVLDEPELLLAGEPIHDDDRTAIKEYSEFRADKRQDSSDDLEGLVYGGK